MYLRIAVLACAGLYLLLLAAGHREFVSKTVILPAFGVYALTLRQPRRFLQDWLPLLAAVITFDYLRGAIYTHLVQGGLVPVRASYVIELEQAIVRTPAAPLVLQPFRTAAGDIVAVGFHASHFLFFLLFGVALWHAW